MLSFEANHPCWLFPQLPSFFLSSLFGGIKKRDQLLSPTGRGKRRRRRCWILVGCTIDRKGRKRKKERKKGERESCTAPVMASQYFYGNNNKMRRKGGREGGPIKDKIFCQFVYLWSLMAMERTDRSPYKNAFLLKHWLILFGHLRCY